MRFERARYAEIYGVVGYGCLGTNLFYVAEMKIAVAHQIAWQIGGAETYLAQLFDWLRQAGYESVLLVANSLQRDSRSEVSPIVDDPHVSIYSIQDLGEETALQSLRDWAPDVIFVNSIAEPNLEVKLQAIARSVRFIHTFEADCLNGSRFHTRPEISVCSHRFGLPCLVRFFSSGCGQNNLPINPRRLREVRDSFRQEKPRLAVLHDYSKIVVMSAYMAQRYRELGLKNVGTAFDEYQPHDDNIHPESSRSSMPIPVKTAARLLFLGRHEDAKGGHILLEALPLIAKELGFKLHLTMANIGSRYEAWKRQAEDIMKDSIDIQIDLPGWKNAEEVKTLIAGSDLLVVPSLWAEPFGLVGVEAARLGCPTVAFDRGGISEWLKDDFNGYLAASNPPSPENLSAAISRCFENPDVLPRFQRNAPEIGRHFELSHHFVRLVRVFQKFRKNELVEV